MCPESAGAQKKYIDTSRKTLVTWRYPHKFHSNFVRFSSLFCLFPFIQYFFFFMKTAFDLCTLGRDNGPISSILRIVRGSFKTRTVITFTHAKNFDNLKYFFIYIYLLWNRKGFSSFLITWFNFMGIRIDLVTTDTYQIVKWTFKALGEKTIFVSRQILFK